MPEHLHLPKYGARMVVGGVHFSLRSAGASSVELCLYSMAEPHQELCRHAMKRGCGDDWELSLPGLDPSGVSYGYRLHGPWAPAAGCFFNPNKLIVDPWALAVLGPVRAHPSQWNGAGPEDHLWHEDSGPHCPKALVVATPPRVDPSERPHHRWEDVVIQEVHVRGTSLLHTGIDPALRGTWLALSQPVLIEHWKSMGVTTLQIMPVFQHLDDLFLLQRGLSNYWGYNTLGYFAPHDAYSQGGSAAGVGQFREMVRHLHQAGLEVILDVVFNHNAESEDCGPMLSLRGLDDAAYFRRDSEGRPVDFTGCGHTINSSTREGLALVMDSLRYWAGAMGVDGFRLDLACSVMRDRHHRFDPRGAVLMAIDQDPALRDLKWIAEPWDMRAPDSYQVGGFPKPWRELNGRYRDTLRRFWRGELGQTAELAKRLCGSQDLYPTRGPCASINLLTSHDGFTLRDWASFAHKHNEANGEENRDGEELNFSDNCGIEGLQASPEILALRGKRCRAMLASMMTSLGVPFFTAGDELGKTQHGNNNAYAQDHPVSWVDWAQGDETMLAFVRHLASLRRWLPALRRSFHLTGQPLDEGGAPDVAWFDFDGNPLTHESWHRPELAGFVALLAGPPPLLWVVCAEAGPRSITLPCSAQGAGVSQGLWRLLLDSSLSLQPSLHDDAAIHWERELKLDGPSLALWQLGEPSAQTSR